MNINILNRKRLKKNNMKEIVKILELDKFEIGIIINALNEFRNKLLKEDRDSDPVDEVLLKVLDAPEKKKTYRHRFEGR